MSVRAKFQCTAVSPEGHVELRAQYSQSPEDQAFWRATPNAVLTMHVVSENALAQFEAGKSYYLDFTPVEE